MTAPSARRIRKNDEQRQSTRRVLAITRASFVLVGTLPWWLPAARAYLPLGPVGQILDYMFVLACHRLPERTIEVAGVAMPLCSRCSGIFTGLALGAIIAWPKPRIAQARIAIAGAGLLMVLDVVAQDLGWHPLWHATRLATGGALGYLLAIALMAAIVRERHPEGDAAASGAVGEARTPTTGAPAVPESR